MKKAKMVNAKRMPPSAVEHNRWCIEMAMKWPTVTTYGGNNGVYSTGGGLPSQTVDADVLGRAAKIHAWVKAEH